MWLRHCCKLWQEALECTLSLASLEELGSPQSPFTFSLNTSCSAPTVSWRGGVSATGIEKVVQSTAECSSIELIRELFIFHPLLHLSLSPSPSCCSCFTRVKLLNTLANTSLYELFSLHALTFFFPSCFELNFGCSHAQTSTKTPLQSWR